MTEEEKREWLWFSACLEIGNYAKKILLETTGSPEKVRKLEKEQAEEILRNADYGGNVSITAETLSEQTDLSKAVRLEQKLQKEQISFISFNEDGFPEKLKSINNAPFGLFYRGHLPSAAEKTCSIVGSRACSYYGRKMALKAGKAAAFAGISVISGMARGIDTAGHEGALAGGGKTYAVLGSGVDVIYPKDNTLLYEKIIETGGGIISEFPPGTQPLPANFPQRNRLISGLSDQVLVMEASVRSGSLITAGFALEQGKEIWALPGRVGDAMSVGTNQLIRDGAMILTRPEDFTEFLQGNSGKDETDCKKIRTKAPDFLDDNQKTVYSCLDSSPISVDMISMLSDLDIRKTVTVLTELEEKGLISQVYESYYAVK